MFKHQIREALEKVMPDEIGIYQENYEDARDLFIRFHTADRVFEYKGVILKKLDHIRNCIISNYKKLCYEKVEQEI